MRCGPYNVSISRVVVFKYHIATLGCTKEVIVSPSFPHEANGTQCRGSLQIATRSCHVKENWNKWILLKIVFTFFLSFGGGFFFGRGYNRYKYTLRPCTIILHCNYINREECTLNLHLFIYLYVSDVFTVVTSIGSWSSVGPWFDVAPPSACVNRRQATANRLLFPPNKQY